jgi:hypothetical protein
MSAFPNFLPKGFKLLKARNLEINIHVSIS